MFGLKDCGLVPTHHAISAGSVCVKIMIKNATFVLRVFIIIFTHTEERQQRFFTWCLVFLFVSVCAKEITTKRCKAKFFEAASETKNNKSARLRRAQTYFLSVEKWVWKNFVGFLRLGRCPQGLEKRGIESTRRCLAIPEVSGEARFSSCPRCPSRVNAWKL